MKKTLTVVLALVLVIAMSVAGTMAYLTSTDTVTNTFTVGNVKITLDEAKVETNGEPVENADRVQENTYKLIPGHEYTKDPTVHVDKDSEDCWLFVKVENGIKDIEGATTIANQMKEKDWSLVTNQTNIYAYQTVVKAGEDVVVFGEFTVAGDADVSAYNGAKVTVTAYAVQADGFETSDDAWNAASSSFTAA